MPFMSDELLTALRGKKDYTDKAYRQLLAKVGNLLETLGEGAEVWPVFHIVFAALFRTSIISF